MSFKAFNHQRKEETRHSYAYSHSTKHLTLLAKNRKAQSALEYMMTYGWAILIIVIVAVILYSMGIFNPSSSITFTSSGFSPFTVSSSLCNNLGYKIAIIAGPIPDNANSLTISKVFLTSATGANTTTASYTLTNPVTLKSGQSATILIPNVACTSANVHYSLSANIQYGYSTAAGKVVENTTGTVAGTSIAGKPSVLTSYEPLTITNSQSSATPSPFQQMVNFTSSDSGWTSISTSNFGQNVEFFYYNGTVIPSWLENYTSSHALWWLKIAAIPAGSSETVYVGFAPTSTNLFNTVNDGEAPQLSSTYGEYDDGENVFNFYANFAGTSLNTSKWASAGYQLPIIDNGLLENTSYVKIYSTTEFNPETNVMDVYAYYTGLYNNKGVAGSQQQDIIWEGNDYAWGLTDWYSSTKYTLGNYNISSSSSSGTLINGGLISSYQIWSIWASKSVTYLSLMYGTPVTNTVDYNNTTYASVMIAVNSGSGYKLYVYWIRVRAYPPNGVMPSVSFGSIA